MTEEGKKGRTPKIPGIPPIPSQKDLEKMTPEGVQQWVNEFGGAVIKSCEELNREVEELKARWCITHARPEDLSQ